LISVYRHGNAQNIRRLIATEGLEADEVALWALDEAHPDLAQFTVGQGPGGRFHLLQACLEKLAVPDDAWLVIADDDVLIGRGGLRRVATVARAMGFDVAQPGHAWNSYYTYPFTLSRPLVVARRTDFIEIGPVLLFSPSARRLVGALGPESPMGWGTDVHWAATSARNEFVMGIVDMVRMRHISRPGRSYSRAVEERALRRALAEAGASSVLEFQRDRTRWWLWQRGPLRLGGRGGNTPLPGLPTGHLD
jgi:hypothetical protein